MSVKTIRILAITVAIMGSAAAEWYDAYDFAAKGVVAYWPFDGNANDVTGNGNEGVMNGGSFITGRLASAVRLNQGQYISAPGSGTLRQFNVMTLACWVIVYSAPPDGQNIMGKGSGSLGATTRPPNYCLAAGPMWGTGQLNFGGSVVDATNGAGCWASSNYSITTWHHAALVFDGSTVSIFVDGVRGESVANNVPIVTTRTSDPFYFNRQEWYDHTASSSRLNCAIDDAVVFNRALSDTEIAALANDSDSDGVADFWNMGKMPMPVITTDGGNGTGANYFTTDSPLVLGGTCSNQTAEIRVNGSITGVSYPVPGGTTWSYEGTLNEGSNTFSVVSLDGANNVSFPDTITVTLDTQPPSVVSAYAYDNTTVRIIFSEDMATGSLITPTDYTFTGGLTASTANRIGDTTAEITVNEMILDTPYTVTVSVSGPEDLAGNKLQLSSNSAEFYFSEPYELGDAALVAQVETGKLALETHWSNDGKKLAFMSIWAPDPTGEVFVVDFANDLSVTRIVANAEKPELGGIPWSPSDEWVLFREGTPFPVVSPYSKGSVAAPGTIVNNVLTMSDLDSTASSGWLAWWGITQTPLGPRALVDIINTAVETSSIYGLPVDANGTPDPSGAVLIAGPCEITTQFPYPEGAMLSLSGDQALISYHHEPSGNFDLYLLTGILDIWSHAAPPVVSINDPRLHPIETDPLTFATPGCWSQDGSLIYYAMDVNGVYQGSDDYDKFPYTDFDIFVVSTDDVIAGVPRPYRLAKPGNQVLPLASHGGTRFAYTSGLPMPTEVYVATLRVSQNIHLGSSNVNEQDFLLRDGAGTTLFIPAGTTCANLGTGWQTIFVYTPISPVAEAQLLQGVTGIPIVRAFGNTGPALATFSPPAQLTISYTDAEIRGLAEAELTVYQYNPTSSHYDIELPVFTRDLDGNRITVLLNSLGETSGGKSGSGEGLLGVAGKADTDGDGISDDRENELGTNPQVADSDQDGLTDYQEVYWDGNEELNAYDPSTNPTGTDLNPLDPDTDGDSVSDGTEVQWGYNPLDPEEAPRLPVATLPVLFALPAIAFLAGRIRLRKRYRCS